MDVRRQGGCNQLFQRLTPDYFKHGLYISFAWAYMATDKIAVIFE